jgi:hypothetical protein
MSCLQAYEILHVRQIDAKMSEREGEVASPSPFENTLVGRLKKTMHVRWLLEYLMQASTVENVLCCFCST